MGASGRPRVAQSHTTALPAHPRGIPTAAGRAPVPTSAPAVPASCAAPTATGHAIILLTLDEGTGLGGAFQANLDTATISAFFQADDGGSAPRDIHIWLSPDHGTITPAPLVIPQCNIRADAELASPIPNTVAIDYTVEPRGYAPPNPARLHALFVRKIFIGIEPKGIQTLSLIAQAPIVTEFFDAAGNIVASDADRTIKFVSNNSLIGPKLPTITVKSGARPSDNTILPYGLGTATLYVTADGLQATTHDFHVVGALSLSPVWRGWSCRVTGFVLHPR